MNGSVANPPPHTCDMSLCHKMPSSSRTMMSFGGLCPSTTCAPVFFVVTFDRPKIDLSEHDIGLCSCVLCNKKGEKSLFDRFF